MLIVKTPDGTPTGDSIEADLGEPTGVSYVRKPPGEYCLEILTAGDVSYGLRVEELR